MASSTEVKQYYDNHRWFVIGGLAACAAAVLGFFQLRKSPAPVASGAPVVVQSTNGFAPADVLNAYGAAASATNAATAAVVGLGTGGMNLAASALADEQNTNQALSGSQAGMGSTLAGLLQGIFAQQPAAIPVASSGGGGVVQNPVIQTPTNSGKTALLTPGDSNIRLLTPGSNAYVIPSQSSYPLGAAVSTSYGPAHQVSQDGQTLNLLDRNYTVI